MQLSSFNRSTRYCDCNYLEIVDIHKLAEMLLTSVSTLRKGWRRLPHFYVGEGSNLKSARFDAKKVIKFLEEEAEEKCNNGTIQTQRQKEGMACPIHDGRANLQKRRVPDKVRSSGVGGKRTIPDKTSRATDTRDDPFDLCEGIKEYLSTYSSDFHQKNTFRQKVFVFRTFITFFQEDPPIEELTPSDFTKYLKARKDANDLAALDNDRLTREQKEFLEEYSFLVRRKGSEGNKVANRDLKEFKALFAWANRQTIIQHNPVINLEPYPEEETPRYIPPVEDIDRVILAATDWELDFIQTLYHTLGRLSEILRLTWKDVNLAKRTVMLRTRKRKGGQIQSDLVPMSETLYSCLKKRWNERDKSSPYVFTKPGGGIYTKNDKPIKEMMDKLCKKAGVRKFGFHAIRHHVAMILEDSGKATLREIQKMLRHRRPTTTDNYLKGLSPSMKRVASILDNPKKSRLKVVEKTES